MLKVRTKKKNIASTNKKVQGISQEGCQIENKLLWPITSQCFLYVTTFFFPSRYLLVFWVFYWLKHLLKLLGSSKKYIFIRIKDKTKKALSYGRRRRRRSRKSTEAFARRCSTKKLLWNISAKFTGKHQC